MKRRRALLALSSALVPIAGCAESEDPPRREPFDPPTDTVPPSVDEGSERDRDADRVPTELSVRSRLANLPVPAFDDRTISYHAIGSTHHSIGSRPELYLAPLTERVSPDAGGHHFLVFNRGTRVASFTTGRFSLLRLDDDEWSTVDRRPTRAPAWPTLVTGPRDHGSVFLDFHWVRDSGGLAPGTYALVLPGRIHGSADRTPRFVAPFVVEPEADLVESGDRTVSIAIRNDGPKYGDPAVLSAELLRPETGAHPALVRLRLRPFERIDVLPSSATGRPIGRSTGDGDAANDDSGEELALTTHTAFREGCWHDDASDAPTLFSPIRAYHGDELYADLHLATGRTGGCARADRYRFENIFRPANSRIESGFEIRLDRG